MCRNRLLTEEEKQKIIEMRFNGYKVQEIAEKMHVSQATISNYTPKGIYNRSKSNCKYAGIKEWLRKNGMSQRAFAKRLYMSEGTLRAYLSGKINVKKSVIDKMLEITGMSYEECFREE